MWTRYNVPFDYNALGKEYTPKYIAGMNCKFRMTAQYDTTSCDVEADVDSTQAALLAISIGVSKLLGL